MLLSSRINDCRCLVSSPKNHAPRRLSKGGELILLVPTAHNITWLERRLDLRSYYSQAGGTAYLRLLLDPATDDAAQ